MGMSLGIDFGTTGTKVALAPDGGLPLPLDIGQAGQTAMPSVVAYSRLAPGFERLSIGEAALNVPNNETSCAVEEVKRLTLLHDHDHGGSFRSPQGDRASITARFPYWDESRGAMSLWGADLPFEEVIFEILSEALERAVAAARRRGLDREVDALSIRGLPARIGTPVVAGLEARSRLAEIARRLGFEGVTTADVLEEPVLVAQTYSHLQEIGPSERVLVFDLGGGTFDAAIFMADETGVVTVLAVDGEPFTGGADIDRTLAEDLLRRTALEQFDSGVEELADLLDASELQRIRYRARDAKEALSNVESVAVSLNIMGGTVNIEVGRKDVIAASSDVIERSLDCALRAFRRSVALEQGGVVGRGVPTGSVFKLEHSDLAAAVDRIILVGGSTKMPAVREACAAVWGSDKLVGDGVIDPIEAACVGAAHGSDVTGVVFDRMPFSVVLESPGEAPTAVYTAYQQTVSHERAYLGALEGAKFPFDPPPQGTVVSTRTPEGQVTSSAELPARFPTAGPRPYLMFDLFGRCLICTGGDKVVFEIAHGYQHETQRERHRVWEQGRAEEQEREKAKLAENLKIPPWIGVS